jgi:hypothetical protein
VPRGSEGTEMAMLWRNISKLYISVLYILSHTSSIKINSWNNDVSV